MITLLFSVLIALSHASEDATMVWRPMDYRRHSVESFPGTYGDRLAQSCGLLLEGTGTEPDL